MINNICQCIGCCVGLTVGEKLIGGCALEGAAGVTPCCAIRKKAKTATIIPVRSDKPVTTSSVDLMYISFSFIVLHKVYGKICL